MLIILAQAMGMCFGVKDALQAVDSLDNPRNVTILGEIVHNPTVQKGLLRRGFRSQAETDRAQLPESQQVLVTAHGISQTYRSRLDRAGKEVVDTTCPLVVKAHKAAAFWFSKGYQLVLVGKPGHVEVLGITEDFPTTLVVTGPQDVAAGLAPKVAVLAQTTTPSGLFHQVVERVSQLNPGSLVKTVDTVCRPTKERQTANQELLRKVEAVVVVGGANSNNTLRLVEQAQAKGLPCWRVEDASELKQEWFSGFRLVGLTAGTSTPQESIDAVHRQLLQWGRPRLAQISG